VAAGAWLGSSWRFPQRQPLPQLQVSPHWHPGRRLVLLAFDVFVDIESSSAADPMSTFNPITQPLDGHDTGPLSPSAARETSDTTLYW
jgi:hypothetical protein